ncbi:MAG: amino acid adenylation domain-containing protein [Pirellulaceae bacterium]
MSNLSDRLRQLSPEKRALLEKTLLRQSTSAPQASVKPKTIPVRPNDAPPLLSPAEQRLWFVDRLEPEHPFYNMPLAATIRGRLDRAALNRSIQEIVNRHEILRTTYHLVDGVPQRRIAASLRIEPEYVHLSSADDARYQIVDQSRRPFDIQAGPLFRAIVYRISDDEHIVLLVMHHIISDGWSMIVMLREIGVLYDAFAADATSTVDVNSLLPKLAIQYADFAHWQHDAATDQKLEQQLAFWRSQLAEAPQVLDFPTDKPRPAVQDFDGATEPIELPIDLTRSIGALARETSCTPFMILLAAQAVLLTRYARQEEIVLGTAVANRTLPELEPLIGFFVGTLPLRIRTAGAPTMRELLSHVREVTLNAFDHAELPFERMVEEFAPSRDRSYSPIFQAAFVMQNLPRKFNHGSTQIEPLHIDNGTAKYDLTFFLWEEGERLIGHVEYRTRLFERETIVRLIENYQTLLEAAVSELDCPIDTLPIISMPQRRQVIDDFNQTTSPLALPHTLHEVFEQQVSATPDAIAVRHQQVSTTYADLNATANQIAKSLRIRGITPERPVVVALPRGVDAVACMYGIFKAGGTYVPVDPAVPISRVTKLAEQVDALLIVTGRDLQSELKFAGFAAANVCELKDQADSDSSDFDLTLQRDVDPTDRAYIIFTSGSTGVSKGVQIEHRGIVNFVRAQTARMEVVDSDRVMHAFSPSFDGALSEVILALSNGATLVIVDAQTLRDPNALTAYLNDERVSVGKFPPALLSMLHSEALPDLKTVASAGDKLTGELASRWIPGRRFFNGYGPTEATVGVSMMLLDEHARQDRPPIGAPMQNMRMYLLDAKRQPVPIGVPGEIYIGGMGVGRGYLNQPELTDSVYCPDPFANVPDARMYRTGDLGRWLPSGVVEFLGRVDDQISLRGYRIEPGEIAAALERLPEVRQAAVVLRGESESGQLVAYVVPEAEADKKLAADRFESEHVDSWSNLFANAHRIAPPVLDPEFNITGWISTYTGQPIPEADMKQWAAAAVERIKALHPRNVLEIGCGTGLMLLQVAPVCDRYVGTDLLESSLENTRQALRRRPELQAKVELFHQPADQFSNLSDRFFDVVVMNSVVQYFPSVDYLVRVIGLAARQLSHGGKIFLGDLRNFCLQTAFATSVELSHATAEMKVQRLRDRVAARIAHDEELLIDPRLFKVLQKSIPSLSRVDVLLKRTPTDNELSRFRYDAVLHFDVAAETQPDKVIQYDESFDWNGFEERMRSDDCEFLLTGVPNQRVFDDQQIADRMSHFDGQATVSQLKESIASCNAIHPEDFWRLGDRHHRVLTISWNQDAPGCFDVWVRHSQTKAVTGDEVLENFSMETREIPATDVDLNRYANNPLASRVQQQFTKHLRDALKLSLPQYMLPAAIMTIDEVPRTINGKVDRGRLPIPTQRPDGASDYQPAETENERCVIDIWEELLDVRPIGRMDNFFELGGHSMLAVRMMSEIQRHTGQSIPLAALFQEPTPAHLAAILDAEAGDQRSTLLVPLRSSEQGTPLFCVHPAGGTVFCYMELARSLKVDRPVFGLQAVGVDGSQPPQETVEQMAGEYVRAINDQHPEGMLHICGWSLGGNIAFEVARQLKQLGRDIGMLALIDAGLIDDESSLREEDFLPLIMALFPGAEAHFSLDELRRKPPAEQLAYFVRQAAQAGIVPDQQEAFGQHIFQVFQANVKAVHQYRADAYEGNLTLVRPTEQARTGALFDDAALGWRTHVREVEVVQIPGDHAHMLRAPAVNALSRIFDARMG